MKYSLIRFEVLPSTNDYVKEHYQELPNYSFCYTTNQTKGRGRLGRNWISEKDKNIAVTGLIKDLKNKEDLSTITLLTATSLHKCLSKYIPNIKIKWPNDLLIDNKKISGILVEGISNDDITNLIIGIGINVNQTDFKELNDITTSLKKETLVNYDLDILLKELLDILYLDIINYLNHDKSYLSYLKNHLYGKSEKVSYYKNDKICEGTIIEIDDDGKLMIENNGIIEHLNSGEIKIIR